MFRPGVHLQLLHALMEKKISAMIMTNALKERGERRTHDALHRRSAPNGATCGQHVVPRRR